MVTNPHQHQITLREHSCTDCNNPIAPWGVSVDLRNSKSGIWRCSPCWDKLVYASKAKPNSGMMGAGE